MMRTSDRSSEEGQLINVRTARPRRALRGPVLIAVSALVAALIPGAATAATTKTLTMSQTFEFGDQKWKETIIATDGASDSVQIYLAKAHKKVKDGKVIYNLHESQSWSFSGLSTNTVDIAGNLTGTIDLGNQHSGLFAADIELKGIDGEKVEYSCNDKLERRVVQKTADSTMSLHTGNDVFGNVTSIPKRATVTVNKGCTGGGGGGGHTLTCPADGEKSVFGGGFNFGGSSAYFNWSGSTNGSISAMTQRSVTSGVSYMAYLSGKVAKNRISVENDLSKGSVDAAGLPRLSGKGTVTDTGNQTQGGWENCGKDKEYRSTSKSSQAMSGDLTFTPSGGTGKSSGDAYDSETGAVSKMDVRNR
jgi:hypothetical protein